ncbi:hypothetical protein ES319_A13G117400v1 [Gossypium barbadense]|uniref:Uncharacterized protein n=2 Tax=Gossypium TaxID=3633 RepID=A0A5J5SYE8_GOSBA|nr:hypothetical protein ES319_A13G117400v1 [Gossypium barbadense]TYG86305.1 hypothetical protein ES288_A13G124100v1 [Gossypium darwinii]
MHEGGIAAANKNDIDQHAVDTVCALNLNSAAFFKINVTKFSGVFCGACKNAANSFSGAKTLKNAAKSQFCCSVGKSMRIMKHA